MTNEERIMRFQKMTEADPENELGHFSLGKALAEDGKFEGAVSSLRRVLELNPTYSKAYQILADVQVKMNHRTEAIATLRTGISVADERGDRMPCDDMVRMLTELGEQPPALKKATPQAASGGKADLICSRCGRPSERLSKAPFRGELGEKIWNNVCPACWHEWVGVGTKVINEMGLALADPRAQTAYDEHMLEFLQLDR